MSPYMDEDAENTQVEDEGYTQVDDGQSPCSSIPIVSGADNPIDQYQVL
jgi:hypothetical protein